EIQNDLLLAVQPLFDHGLYAPRIDRRPIDAERLAERAHPQVILIELLPAGERPPRDQLVHVRVAGVVADFLTFQPRPDRRGDDLPWLRDDVAEANFLFVLREGEVRVLAPGRVRQGRPGLDGSPAIRLRRQ